MKHMAFVVFSTLLALPVAASAQGVSGEDPLLGTWRLNVSQSRYRPGPPPKSQTRTYEKYRDGIRATVRTVEADGRSVTVQSVFDYDKQEHPVTGSEDVDVIVVTRVDAFTHEATLLHAGRPIGTLRRVISADGKRMTVFDQRVTPQTDNTEFYEKDEQ
jgi:hypothetical protein